MVTFPVDTILRHLSTGTATITRGVSVTTALGIFIRAHVPMEIAGILVDSASPHIVISSEAASTVDKTATVTYAGTVYKVIDVRDLGNGFTDLILSKD